MYMYTRSYRSFWWFNNKSAGLLYFVANALKIFTSISVDPIIIKRKFFFNTNIRSHCYVSMFDVISRVSTLLFFGQDLCISVGKAHYNRSVRCDWRR